MNNTSKNEYATSPNEDASSKEYLMLRDEILKTMDIVQNSRHVLYVSMAAILSFAVSQ